MNLSALVNSFMAPGSALVRALRYGPKFLLISAAFCVPLALTLYFFTAEVSRGIAVVRSEQTGVEYIRAVCAVLDDLRQGKSVSSDKLDKLAKIQLEQVGSDFGPEVKATGDSLRLELKAHQQDSLARRDSAIATGELLVTQVAQHSQIVLDPSTESYYTAESTITRLQDLVNGLYHLSTLDASAATSGATSPVDFQEVKLQEIKLLASMVTEDLRFAKQVSPRLAEAVARPEARLSQALDAMYASPRSGTNRRATSIAALEATSDLFDTGTSELQHQLARRGTEFQQRRDGVLLVSALGTFFAGYVFIAFYRESRSELGRLAAGINRIPDIQAAVDFEETRHRDEVGEVARVLSTMIESLKEEQHSRRSLEAQLREAQRMEAIGLFSAGIAHDFNNCLQSIRGNLELALLDMEADHPSRASLLESINAAARVKDLIEQIATFGRRDIAGKRQSNLAEVIESVGALMRLAVPTNVVIKSSIDESLGGLSIDPTPLEQIVLNLATNAWQALEGKPGTVHINGRVAHHAGLSESPVLLLEVSDTGAGIPESNQSRIFELFFTTKPAGSGTGLGLSVVYGIVRSYGGLIELESVENEGTTFKIYLPVLASQIQPTAPPEPPVDVVANLEDVRILYLDDDDSVLFLIERMMARMRSQVKPFSDPDLALEEYRSHPDAFDVVITDQRMPKMLGIDFARQILAINPNQLVILASGFISGELSAEAEAAGVRHLIYKPNTMEELGAAIAMAVRTHRPSAGQ